MRPGDTLWSIADKHSTSINAIKSANRLKGETIAVGQTLVISGSAGGGTVEPSTPGVYFARPGDSMSEVARLHGVSLDALARANPSAYPDRLLVGERLVIPGKKTTAPAASTTLYPPAIEAPAAASKAHVVKKGESLGAIAKNYGISTASLAAANKLKNANLIEVGQRLVIPGTRPAATPAPAPHHYPLADSDTLPMPGASLMLAAPTPALGHAPAPYSTAPAYEMVSAPVSQMVSKPLPPLTSSNRRGVVAYPLERGDDINTVAALFNTTPEKIRELNKLPPDRKLKEGDEVVVPALGAVSLN